MHKNFHFLNNIREIMKIELLVSNPYVVNGAANQKTEFSLSLKKTGIRIWVEKYPLKLIFLLPYKTSIC